MIASSRRRATTLLAGALFAVASITGSAGINDDEHEIPPCPGCVATPDPDGSAVLADDTFPPGDSFPDIPPCPGCVA